MYCNKCGNKIQKESLYCNECGAPVAKKDESQNIEIINLDESPRKGTYNATPAAPLKKKKKFGCLTVGLLIFIVVFFLFVVLSRSNDSTNTNNVEELTPDSLATIESTVLYAENGITLTAIELNYDRIWDLYNVKINIQNNTQKTITYSASGMVINGYSFDANMFGDITAGNNANVDYGVSKADLELAGVSNIMEIRFAVRCYYSDSKEDICYSNALLKTSDYGKVNQGYSPQGILSYDSNGIKVYVKPNLKDKIKAPAILYVENNTDRVVSLLYKNISYNNTMVQQMHSGFIILPQSHKVAEMKITMFSYEHNITQLEKMSFQISFQPYKKDGGFSTANAFESDVIDVVYN